MQIPPPIVSAPSEYGILPATAPVPTAPNDGYVPLPAPPVASAIPQTRRPTSDERRRKREQRQYQQHKKADDKTRYVPVSTREAEDYDVVVPITRPAKEVIYDRVGPPVNIEDVDTSGSSNSAPKPHQNYDQVHSKLEF